MEATVVKKSISLRSKIFNVTVVIRLKSNHRFPTRLTRAVKIENAGVMKNFFFPAIGWLPYY
jgi:hypothetical protein